MNLKIGSLFSGYGGLDMGVQAVVGGDVVWHVEFDAAPSKILAHHWPTVPNYGDITTVDWAQVEPVDVLTGGFPCQDLSLAGRRAGMRPGTRSGLWADFLKAIDALRPGLVVIENVRGLLSGCAESEADSDRGQCPRCANPSSGAKHAPNVRALGRVLIDLAGVGYDAEWVGIRAADTGAPHGRFRVFVLAEDPNLATGSERRQSAPGQTESGRTRADTGRRGGTPLADAGGNEPERWGIAGDMGSAPSSSESAEEERQRLRNTTGNSGQATAWGVYEPAIRRWEHTTGRIAPSPTNPDGKNGQHRLSAQFVEWMMGLPEGHVTGEPEAAWRNRLASRRNGHTMPVGMRGSVAMRGPLLTRNEQLKALGNGVVPQQAELALRMLLQRNETEVAA